MLRTIAAYCSPSPPNCCLIYRNIEYEGCERLRHEILVQLHERQQHTGLPVKPEFVKLTTSIQSKLDQFRKDVGHLKVVLDNAITWETSPEEELQRRRIAWDKLSSQLREIETNYTKSTRSNYLPVRETSPWQNAGSAAGAGAAPARPTDAAALKKARVEIMEQQNRGLEVLSASISRQRDLAMQLGNEVEDQNNILGDMSNTMDRVESGVQRETSNIGLVSRSDSTWGYWLVIIGLFVAIVVVIFV